MSDNPRRETADRQDGKNTVFGLRIPVSIKSGAYESSRSIALRVVVSCGDHEVFSKWRDCGMNKKMEDDNKDRMPEKETDSELMEGQYASKLY